jgi:parallel beta-helix repeat protein
VRIDLNGHRVEGARFNHFIGIDDSGGFDRVRIVDGQISRFETGVLLASSEHSKVADNTITGGDGPGINLTGSSDNRVLDNSVESGHAGLSLTDSHDNVVRDNSLLGDPALSITTSHENRFRDNAFTGGGHGVWVRLSNDNLFAHNSASSRTFPGFELISGSGNELNRNTVSHSGESGIVVYAAAQSTWLERNTADGNSFDGILVNSPSTVLRRNSASNNGSLGINAVDGVTDAGGNRASGNRDPRQCVGVRCRP